MASIFTVSLYPKLSAAYPKKPSRLYALPLVGFLIKMVILIPVFIEAVGLGIAWVFVSVINSFVVLFTGRYWDSAYNFTLAIMRFSVKIRFYLYGFTDRYPGFSLRIEESYDVDMAKPKNPSRLFAIPVIGGIIRIILLIPYGIYDTVLQNGTTIAILVSSFPVLFSGRYPESTYEFGRDYTRVNLAAIAYMAGLSDNYPSFQISMNHKRVKIALIIIGALLTFNNFTGWFGQKTTPPYRGLQQYNTIPRFVSPTAPQTPGY